VSFARPEFTNGELCLVYETIWDVRYRTDPFAPQLTGLIQVDESQERERGLATTRPRRI